MSSNWCHRGRNHSYSCTGPTSSCARVFFGCWSPFHARPPAAPHAPPVSLIHVHTPARPICPGDVPPVTTSAPRLSNPPISPLRPSPLSASGPHPYSRPSTVPIPVSLHQPPPDPFTSLNSPSTPPTHNSPSLPPYPASLPHTSRPVHLTLTCPTASHSRGPCLAHNPLWPPESRPPPASSFRLLLPSTRDFPTLWYPGHHSPRPPWGR